MLFRLFLLVILNILLSPLYAVLAVVAFLLTFIPIFPSRVGIENLTKRFGASRIKAHFLLAGVFMHYVFYFLEAAVFFPLGLSLVGNENEFREFLATVKEKFQLQGGTGLIVLGAHYGNMEETGRAASDGLKELFGSKLYSLAKPAAHPVITKVLDWYRNKRKIALIWTDRKDLTRALLKSAKGGDSIAYLIDQKPESNGAFIKFFGEYSAFPVAGLEPCVRAGMPVIYLFLRRRLPGFGTLFYTEGLQPHLPQHANSIPHGNLSYTRAEALYESLTPKEESLIDIMAGYASFLETAIRLSPAQWCWDYKKWSRKPRAK